MCGPGTVHAKADAVNPVVTAARVALWPTLKVGRVSGVSDDAEMFSVPPAQATCAPARSAGTVTPTTRSAATASRPRWVVMSVHRPEHAVQLTARRAGGGDDDADFAIATG